MSDIVPPQFQAGAGDRESACVVVAGLGNEYRRDDGVGPAVAARIAGVGSVRDIGPIADPLDLLGRWDGADLAIVIDAIRSSAPPGTVHVVEVPAGPPGHDVTSTHGISLGGVLRLSQAIGRAPGRVVVVGIEAVDFGSGKGLSPEVDAAVAVAVQRVIGMIEEVNTCA